jgi:DNA polymerase I-like protein with 3'-5' exonuclease and polymerase domains
LFTDFGGYDDDFNRKYDKGKMEQIPTEDLRVYAGGDTDACYQAGEVLQDELIADPELARFYVTILHPASRAFEKIERRGVLVDQEKFAVLRDDLKKAVKESQQRQLALLPPKLKIKYRERIDDQLSEGKNPMLPSILHDFFFTPQGLNLKPQLLTPKDHKPSLAKSHLLQVADGHAAAAAFITEMTIGDTAEKTLSTFVEGFLKHLRPDGRFHPSYMLFHGGFGDDEDDESGTVTGRLSAKEPAFQTIPKKKPKIGENWPKRLRECYPAPPGKTRFSVDYSQGELKVVACIAPEKRMIKVFLDGHDIHATTGAKIAGVSFEEFLTWKENEDKHLADEFERIRGNAKPVNFGLLYGQSPKGFQAYAWKAYGVKFSLEECEKIVKDFFELYPMLLDYHKRQRDFAALQGHVRSPLGRIRHLPNIYSPIWSIKGKAERQAINCLSDDAEILTASGWRTVDEVSVGDLAVSVNPADGRMELCPIEALHVGKVSDAPMWQIEHSSISAIATPNHRWLIDFNGKPKFKTSSELTMNGHDKIWVSANGLHSEETVWSDDEITLMGWVLTDGHYKKQLSPKSGKDWARFRIGVTQSKAEYIPEIDALFARLGKHAHQVRNTGQHLWEITCSASRRIRETMPDKTLTANVLYSMSQTQRKLLFVTMLKGDGCWDSHAGRWRKFVSGTKERAEAFMMLSVLVGQPARAVERDFSAYEPKKYDSMGNVPKAGKCWFNELAINARAQPQYGSKWIKWSGRVWCPTLKHGTWVAKRNDKAFITGNSPVQSCLADIMEWAIARIDQEFPNEEIQIIGNVHDAIVGDVDSDKVDALIPQVIEIMSNLPFHEIGWKPALKFTVDAEVGPNLAALKKWKL